MKVSVTLAASDVQFVDRYAAAHARMSRSEVVRMALALLRDRELGDAYQSAWKEWVEDGGEIWDQAVGDGIDDVIWDPDEGGEAGAGA